MFNFGPILTNLQTIIAAKAARDRSLTVLLVALWGRIARMRTRLERLVALWRAGKLPAATAPRVEVARVAAPRGTARLKVPTAPGWLRRKLGYEVAACGSQLQHLLTDAEARAFLAACPRAGRILRPLLRMLSADPVPEVMRIRAMPVAVEAARRAAGVVVAPIPQFSDA